MNLFRQTVMEKITHKVPVSRFGLPKMAAQTHHFWNPKTPPTSTLLAGHMYFSKFTVRAQHAQGTHHSGRRSYKQC